MAGQDRVAASRPVSDGGGEGGKMCRVTGWELAAVALAGLWCRSRRQRLSFTLFNVVLLFRLCPPFLKSHSIPDPSVIVGAELGRTERKCNLLWCGVADCPSSQGRTFGNRVPQLARP